jgi:hypothetical protein
VEKKCENCPFWDAEEMECTETELPCPMESDNVEFPFEY